MSTSRAVKGSVLLLRQEASELAAAFERDVGGEPGRCKLSQTPKSTPIEQRPQHLRFGARGQAGLVAVKGALAFSAWEGRTR
jgi:hypothetical protein